MSNILIPIFDEIQMKASYQYLNKTGHGGSPKQYKQSASFDQDIIIKNLIEIRDHVMTESHIKERINTLLAVEGLKDKLGMISDGSYCNFRILISPDEFWFTSIFELRKAYPIAKEKLPESHYSNEEIYNFFIEYGERLMISIDYEPWSKRITNDYYKKWR
jgi:hypothetical protein